MKYTGNYNLKKPEGSDTVNIDDLNDNFDAIDQALKNHEDDLATKETPAGAQAKAEAAAGAVQAELDAHLADNTPHREAATLHRKNKDENGIYTRLEWYRADGTLFKTSELEGESPQYATRRVKFYAEDGQTLVQEVVYSLTYDENGELISEVIQA